MFHFQILRLLSAYTDGELDQPIAKQIHIHVQHCDSCADKVEKIQIAKKAVAYTVIPQAPESLWRKIEKELFETDSSKEVKPISPFSMKFLIQSPNLKLASMFAGFVLLAISVAWWEIEYNNSTDSPQIPQSSLEAGFDYGAYLDAIVAKNSTAEFLEYYDGVPVNLKIATTIANEGNFHLCLYPKVVPDYDLQEVLVLTDGDDHSLKLDYVNAGDLVTIFQQPVTLAHSLGERETEEVMISGVACLKVVEGDIAVLTWESGNTRFVAVGNSVTIDFEEIVSASIKHSKS